MTWLFTLLAMAVIALVAGVVTGRITGAMGPAETSLAFRGLPADRVTPEDLAELRFDAALRGYRMSEVDEVLDRCAAELRRRDAEIAELRAALGEQAQQGQAPDGQVRGADPAFDQTLDPAFDQTLDPAFDQTLDPAFDQTLDPAYTPPAAGFRPAGGHDRDGA